MRLWHKDLISVLPRQQLIGQWRECCLISKNIAEKGTPNHILVNRIMEFPLEHFLQYTELIQLEMIQQGYRANWSKFNKTFEKISHNPLNIILKSNLFLSWHDDRYLTQCFYNLQEKYDCGGITDEEWILIRDKYYDIIK